MNYYGIHHGIEIHKHTNTNIYLYMYINVCVCVCAYVCLLNNGVVVIFHNFVSSIRIPIAEFNLSSLCR